MEDAFSRRHYTPVARHSKREREPSPVSLDGSIQKIENHSFIASSHQIQSTRHDALAILVVQRVKYAPDFGGFLPRKR